MSGEEAGERGGEPGLRVDAVQLAGLDQRSDHRPVVAALVGAGEQCVFAIGRERADRTLDGVGVDLDAAVVEEPAEPVPAIQGIADRLGELALAAGAGEAGLQEPAQARDQGSAALLPYGMALVGGAARISCSIA